MTAKEKEKGPGLTVYSSCRPNIVSMCKGLDSPSVSKVGPVFHYLEAEFLFLTPGRAWGQKRMWYFAKS